MADMKITEYNSHNAPATGDQFFMIGTSEEYRIDYDALASAILDKLTTKTYSGISNNVIDAIAALNSSLSISLEKISDKNITMYKSGHFGLLRIDQSFDQSSSYVEAGKFTNMRAQNNFYYSYVNPSNGRKAKIKFDGSNGTLSVMSPEGATGIDCSFPILLQ